MFGQSKLTSQLSNACTIERSNHRCWESFGKAAVKISRQSSRASQRRRNSRFASAHHQLLIAFCRRKKKQSEHVTEQHKARFHICWWKKWPSKKKAERAKKPETKLHSELCYDFSLFHFSSLKKKKKAFFCVEISFFADIINLLLLLLAFM